jgi:hypothetical protein
MKKKLLGIILTAAIGLITVSGIVVVVSATTLITSLYSMADNELEQAKSYNDSATARMYADKVIEEVRNQIKASAADAAAPEPAVIDGTRILDQLNQPGPKPARQPTQRQP